MVKLKIPLADVVIKESLAGKEVSNPVCRGEQWQANGNEFAMQVPGMGSFYACDGREVVYCIEQGADPEWVQLYLNGQVLVAMLHQRKIINFHASSFMHDSRGVMILGETGAGKSSLTAAFSLNGATFLTDDLTPVIFKDSKAQVWPLYRAIKLRDNTISQLNIGTNKLARAEEGTGKQYLHLEHGNVTDSPLHIILKIETGDCSKPEFHEPTPPERFSLLRSEICSWEMLAGMPETEEAYLDQLLMIVRQVDFIRVVRPADIMISGLYTAIREYLDHRLR
jgi:hypothetical protein